jgi:hypothetical protein
VRSRTAGKKQKKDHEQRKSFALFFTNLLGIYLSSGMITTTETRCTK